MKSEEVELLKGENYISFSTKKRSGEFVATPVWFAPHGGSLYLFSATDVGKVKRLRNFSESAIAACTMRGTVTGEWIDTVSVLLNTQEDKDIALKALRRKYGLQMKIGDIFANITGKMAKRTYIKVDIK
jgi:PPOX class probable F420-dependent enzyme